MTASADAAIRLLTYRYFERSGAPTLAAVDALDRGESLAKALRPRVSGRVPRATAMRTALDSLLEYASLVEIVHQVSHEAPAWSYKQWTADVLSEPELRLHYERDERQVLPILLRWRLEGFRAPGEPAEVESAGSRLWLFSEFLALNGMLDPPPTESGMEALVRMLCEGATDDGYTLGHLLETIADHDGSTSVLRRNDGLLLAVESLSTFLTFCDHFECFLLRVPSPLLQSSFWHFHSEWFDRLRDPFTSGLSLVFDRLTESSRPESETRRSIDRIRPVVARLFSGRYASAWREQLLTMPAAGTVAALPSSAAAEPGVVVPYHRPHVTLDLRLHRPGLWSNPASVIDPARKGSGLDAGRRAPVAGWNRRIGPQWRLFRRPLKPR